MRSILMTCAALCLGGPALGQSAPENAPPGTCWGRADSSNRVRTVVRDLEVVAPQYAADGTLLRPGVYRREEVRELVSEADGAFFEIPCDNVLVPDFVASLQRALAVRGLYVGSITGSYNRGTRAAVRIYQEPMGIDSAQVSRRMAEELGLAVSTPESRN